LNQNLQGAVRVNGLQDVKVYSVLLAKPLPHTSYFRNGGIDFLQCGGSSK
jgi:hypothetical protein